MTRAHVGLLGPCFKTGRVEDRPIRHRPLAPAAYGSVPERGCRALQDSASAVERPSTARGRRTRQRPRSRRVSTSTALTLRPEGRSYLAAGLMTAPEPVVALDAGESAPCLRRARQRRRPCRIARCRRPRGCWAEFPGSTLRIHPFASMRFHVLLNSLFKVLFNFPSRYLSAIGLVPVFSLRWSLPPALGCIPKQPDSKEARSRRRSRRQGPDTRSGQGHDQEDLSARDDDNRPPIHHISRRPLGRKIRCWALPASLAVTRGILVSFFSSAY